MAIVYVPNGIMMDNGRPDEGANFANPADPAAGRGFQDRMLISPV
jgi:hypothetical protein